MVVLFSFYIPVLIGLWLCIVIVIVSVSGRYDIPNYSALASCLGGFLSLMYVSYNDRDDIGVNRSLQLLLLLLF